LKPATARRESRLRRVAGVVAALEGDHLRLLDVVRVAVARSLGGLERGLALRDGGSRAACTGASHAWRVDRQFSTQSWSLLMQASVAVWKSSLQPALQSLKSPVAALMHRPCRSW